MSDFTNAGRIAVATGGATGIGNAIATGLAAAGATIVIAGRRGDVAEDAAAKLRDAGHRAEAMTVDVTVVAQITRLFAAVEEKYGRLDILVTSAGTNRRKPMLACDEASWDAVLGTNLKGAFFTAQAAARLMHKGGGTGESFTSARSPLSWRRRCKAATAPASPGSTD